MQDKIQGSVVAGYGCPEFNASFRKTVSPLESHEKSVDASTVFLKRS
jgi:hypothetical protein